MCTARACARVRAVSPYYGCNPKHISSSSPSLTIRQIVSPSMWPAGRGVMTRPCPFPFNWDWLVYFNWAIFSKLRPPHPRWKCGRVKLLDVAFYIIFHNSLTLNNVWSTLWAPVPYNRDLWNGHLQMPSLYYSVPPQHIIIQTWEAGLTSSEIIAPLWYIYLFINTLFILFRANPTIITWEACSTSSDTCLQPSTSSHFPTAPKRHVDFFILSCIDHQ